MFKEYLTKRRIKKYAKKMPKKLAEQFGEKSSYTEEEVEVILKLSKLYKKTSVDNSYAYAMFCSDNSYISYLAHSPGVEDYEAARELIRSTIFPDASAFNFSSLLIDSNSLSDVHSGGSGFSSGLSADSGDCDGGSD